MKNQSFVFILLGVFLGIIGATLYFLKGYSLLIPFLWIASIIITGSYFYHKGEFNWKLRSMKHDVYIILFLLILFAPIYLYSIYTLPFQVNTDEVTIMFWERSLSGQPQPDIFALSEYFSFPAFIFIVLGWLGKAMGGVTLLHMRIIHALSGLLIIAVSYVFFRSFAQKKIAVGAAIIVGANHSLIAISRMAMRDNIALLLGVLALALLMHGLKNNSLLRMFSGGVVAGLAYYGYYPGRFTFIVWFFFLAMLAVFYRHKFKLPVLIKYGAVTFLGFMLVVLPLLTAMAKQVDEPLFKEGAKFQREALLLFPEGQQVQKDWVFASSVSEGVKTNIIYGLTTYNNRVVDHSWNYPNRNHGFVDPITGILLWIGLAVIVLKRSTREEHLLIFGSFLLYLFIFSFIVNKSPNYTRLLITLPFVAYLAVLGLKYISELIAKLHRRLNLNYEFQVTTAVFVLSLVSILFWNLIIVSDFAMKGVNEGDIVGGTARYIEERTNIADYSFYLAANNAYPYYSWGQPRQWTEWFGYFAGSNQQAKVLSPDSLVRDIASPPFTIFMSDKLWLESKEILTTQYPDLVIHDIKPDGSHIAIEVR